MAKLTVKAGATSRREYVLILDSTSTSGAGDTGLLYNTSGLKAYYVRPGASATAITLATQTVTGAFSSGGFVEVDATNMPGIYRFDVPDAVFAAGVDKAIVMLSGATGMAPVALEYDLVAYDPQDTVRLGLTALPNVASGSAGAIITSGTGTAQLSTTSGNVTVGTNNDKTGYSLTQAFPTNFSSLAITAGGIVTANTTQWAGVAVTGMPMPTYTQPTGFLAATFPTTVASTTNITSASGVTLASSQTFSTTGSVGSVTGAVGSVTSAVTVGTINANVITASSIASSAITSAKIATDAIDSNALAASAVTEIQSGLSTLNATAVENAVWDATMTSHTGSTTYGGRVIRAANSNVTASLTGANHIAADIHELQPGVISDGDFAAGTTYEKLGTLIEADTPSGYHFTTQALEQAPSGGAGSWPLNNDQTTGLKRMISAVVGVGGETATPGVLEFDMVGETTTLRITQSVDGNDRLTVEEV